MEDVLGRLRRDLEQIWGREDSSRWRGGVIQSGGGSEKRSGKEKRGNGGEVERKEELEKSWRRN